MPMDENKYVKKGALFIRDLHDLAQKKLCSPIIREQTIKTPKGSKMLIYISLLSILFFSMFLKYSHGGLQGGIDSYVHHGFTNMILESGRIPWIKSVFSYFGLYPVSTPSGLPALMAAYSSATSTNIFYLITPYSLILTLVASLGMFMASMQFKRNTHLAICVSAVFTLTTRYSYYTHQQMLTRGLFISLLPLFLWMMFRFMDRKNMRIYFMMFLFGTILISIHRMGMFILLIVLGLGLGYVIHHYILLVPHGRSLTIVNTSILLLSIFALVSMYFYTENVFLEMIWRITPDVISGDESLGAYLASLAYNYAKFAGVFIIFAPLGFLFLLFKGRREIKETALMFTVIPFLFLLGGTLYVSIVLLPLLSILMMYALFVLKERITRKSIKKLSILFLVFIIVITSVIPGYILYRDIDNKYPFWISETSVEAGLYSTDHSTIGDYIYSRQMNAFTHHPSGVVLDWGYGGIDRFDYDTVEAKSIQDIFLFPRDPFTIDDWFWLGRSLDYSQVRRRIYTQHVDHPEVQEWLREHNVRYFVLHRNTLRHIYREEQPRVNMQNTVPFQRYAVYRNHDMSLYWL